MTEENMKPLVESEAGFTQAKVSTVPQIGLTEMQLRLAHEYPRQLDVVLKKALAELRFDPDGAEEMFYQIPYRNVRKGTVNMVDGQELWQQHQCHSHRG